MLEIDNCSFCFISNENIPVACVLCVYSSADLFVAIFCIGIFRLGSARLSSARLSSPGAVVLQFSFQASFISYTGVAAFLIFQTNSHVSIAACQFWFYDSFIIKCVRLQCSAADGLLHFRLGQGRRLLCACVGGEDGRLLAHVRISPWRAFRFVWVISEQMWVGTKHKAPSQTT